MRIIIIKNETSLIKTWIREFQPGEEYTLPAENPSLCAKYACNDSLLNAITAGEATISDGNGILSTKSLQVDWLKGVLPHSVDVRNQTPFADNTLQDGTKVYRRVHGISLALSANETKELLYTVPYTKAAITGAQVVGGAIGDSVSFKVYDTDAGTISGVPNYMLNQFGFSVYINKDFHSDTCNYYASLIEGLKIGVTFTNSLAEAKTVFFNLILHEIKS
jgi:hypothetical protein